jgi:hypothetical protein
MTTYLNLTPPVPTPAPYVLPDGMVMNPFWDQNLLFGIPIWTVCLTALVILLACLGIRWLFRIMKMAPVAGYKDAVVSGDAQATQVWYFGLTGGFAIFCLTLKERVLTYSEDSKLLDKWVITSVDCRGSCGGVPMVMVSPTSELVKDVPAEKAIVIISHWLNKTFGYDKDNNPIYVEFERDDGTKVKKHAFIKNFEDYLFFLPYFEKKFPDGVDVPVYGFYDPSENQGFTERGSTAEFWGARRERKARKLYMMQKEDKGWLMANIKFLSVCVFCIMALIIAWQVAVS